MESKKQIARKLLLRYECKEEWMGDVGSLHGPAHMARVFILQELIADQLEREGVKFDREATR